MKPLAAPTLGRVCLLFALAAPLPAQEPAEVLTEQVAELDALVFDAFNDRDFERFMGFFTPDLEFLHDIDGLVTYADLADSSRRLFSAESPIRRRLVPGSLEVHPVPGYGAIQIGRHEFCHLENGRDDCGVFGFTHIWRHTDEGWRIARVLSYGH